MAYTVGLFAKQIKAQILIIFELDLYLKYGYHENP
jgi:hypothetical protein